MSDELSVDVPSPNDALQGWTFLVRFAAGLIVVGIVGPPIVLWIIKVSGGKPHGSLPTGGLFALFFAWLALLLCGTSVWNLVVLSRGGNPRPIRLIPLSWVQRILMLPWWETWGRSGLGVLAMVIGFGIGTTVFK
jgi:hypothetical protein